MLTILVAFTIIPMSLAAKELTIKLSNNNNDQAFLKFVPADGGKIKYIFEVNDFDFFEFKWLDLPKTLKTKPQNGGKAQISFSKKPGENASDQVATINISDKIIPFF
jgi:hypothetical protein